MSLGISVLKGTIPRHPPNLPSRREGATRLSPDLVRCARRVAARGILFLILVAVVGSGGWWIGGDRRAEEGTRRLHFNCLRAVEIAACQNLSLRDDSCKISASKTRSSLT